MDDYRKDPSAQLRLSWNDAADGRALMQKGGNRTYDPHPCGF